MKPLNYFLLLFSALILSYGYGQQLPIYQHAYIVRSAYNPAEVLNEKNEIEIYALRGNQFQKFQGGFVNNYANFSTPLDDVNIGLGLDMASRSYGPITQLSIGFAYAYRVRFDKNTSLVLGTRVGFMEHRFNKSLINPYDDDDLVVDAIPDGQILPNGNVGVTFRSKIGSIEFAVPQLLSNRFLNTSAAEIQSITLLPHLYSRYSVDLEVIKNQVQLSPIVSIRYMPNTVPQFEGGLTATFNNSLWVNTNYRSDYSFAIGVGFKANEKWTIAYSYDRPVVNRYSFNANNHEILFGYTFQRGQTKPMKEEWSQAENSQKVRMDSISSVQDLTMAEEYLRFKLAEQKKRDSLIQDSISRSPNADYKNILVEINMVDSIFESATARTTQEFTSNSKSNNNSSAGKETISKQEIETILKEKEEDAYLASLNKNNPDQIKIVRNKQPNEKYFVELSGEDSPRGYYLITGVFSTLERAQNFRWKENSDMSKIIFNNKNQYFYVVYSYSETKSVKELEPTIKEYRLKKRKIWILDY